MKWLAVALATLLCISESRADIDARCAFSRSFTVDLDAEDLRKDPFRLSLRIDNLRTVRPETETGTIRDVPAAESVTWALLDTYDSLVLLAGDQGEILVIRSSSYTPEDPSHPFPARLISYSPEWRPDLDIPALRSESVDVVVGNCTLPR